MQKLHELSVLADKQVKLSIRANLRKYLTSKLKANALLGFRRISNLHEVERATTTDALTFRNMFGHQIRMLGRPFSRSVATGLPGIDLSGDSRRHSLRVIIKLVSHGAQYHGRPMTTDSRASRTRLFLRCVILQIRLFWTDASALPHTIPLPWCAVRAGHVLP